MTQAPQIEDNTSERAASTTPQALAPTAHGGPAGSDERAELRARRLRDAWFMLGVLALGVVTLFALTTMGTAVSQRAPAPGATATRTTASATSPSAPNGALPAGVQRAQVRAFNVSPANAGLMQPAVDAAGNVWFGEMTTNKLARLDPRTGRVDTWAPPQGRYNIMATAIDTHGDVWFTEQASNYIGRFHPATAAFTTYPLEQVNGHGVAPQDLVFDARGMLYFTEVSGAKIGRLDPATGAIATWTVPAPASGGPSYPYAIAAARDGAIWFGDLTGGAIGRLDAASGAVKLYALADKRAQIFSMVADDAGRVWFTELQGSKLGMMDTHTGTLREISVPATLGTPTGLYAVTVAASGDVWFACASANALVRYVPGTQTFTFYQLQIPASIPYGVAFDRQGTLWFTADATTANYVGALAVK